MHSQDVAPQFNLDAPWINIATGGFATTPQSGTIIPVPPPSNFFLLLDATDFLLLDTTQFLLL